MRPVDLNRHLRRNWHLCEQNWLSSEFPHVTIRIEKGRNRNSDRGR
jgi:hypothetical protein